MNIKTAELKGAQFSHQYHDLGEQFFANVLPTPVSEPSTIAINTDLAMSFGLDEAQLASDDIAAMFAGNVIPTGALPIAQAYAGHQFGHYNPQLGDGRAILLGELCDTSGLTWDIQLKGAGPTPFSRNGDGRAAMGPVIREFILGEAMHKLGIKTTRALAAVATGEAVYRQTPLPGAILTRIASSHVRVGTFEYFRANNDLEALNKLANFVIERHYPEAAEASQPLLALLEAVLDAQISLVASWMSIGFIHGVMNTDNTAISGETLDYGPCAFMEAYDSSTVFSSIDSHGRYAYGNQASIGLWNLTRFAECLFPILEGTEQARVKTLESILASFAERFNTVWLHKMGRKIGFESIAQNQSHLVQDLLQMMQNNGPDFTSTFNLLGQPLTMDDPKRFFELFPNSQPEINKWFSEWKTQLEKNNLTQAQVTQTMTSANPFYIPRNNIIEDVIRAATYEDNLEPMQKLMEVLETPYTKKPVQDYYTQAAVDGSKSYKTFCGT